VATSLLATILRFSTSKKEEHTKNERQGVTEPHLTKILFKNICKVQSPAVNKHANLKNTFLYLQNQRKKAE
jgi:hypothetical protein